MTNILSMKQLRQAANGVLLTLLVACTSAASAAPIVMYRDAGCGCCLKWAHHAETNMDREITVKDEANMAARKSELGVPSMLASCHTAIIDGYIIEGHVPAEDIKRLLETRPAGVAGLAVPGMPVGSPGMEYENRTQPYEVIAFGESGLSVFSRHN